MWLLHAPTAEHLAEHSIQKKQPGEKECKGATSTHQLPQSSELMLRRWLTISSAYPRLKRELTTLICPFLNAAVWLGWGQNRKSEEEEKKKKKRRCPKVHNGSGPAAAALRCELQRCSCVAGTWLGVQVSCTPVAATQRL